jgi:hypothetical protein
MGLGHLELCVFVLKIAPFFKKFIYIISIKQPKRRLLLPYIALLKYPLGYFGQYYTVFPFLDFTSFIDKINNNAFNLRVT